MPGNPHEGTVFQNKQGRWMAFIELPRGPNGKRQRRLRRARTKTEAKAKLAEMREELRKTGTISDANRRMSEAVETFRTDRPPSPNDDWLLGLVLSGLGGRRVKQLTVADCDRFLAECAKGIHGNRPIGTSHLRRVKQRLTAVLRNEVRLGMVMNNVAEVAKLPASDVGPKERRSLTVEELRRLLDITDGAIGVLVDLCGRNGLRPAEARALRWQDVDLDQGVIEITGQMDRTNTRGPVKRAANASRILGIDQRTADRLKAWRDVRSELQAKARSAWTEQDFIAVGATGQPIGRESFAIAMRSLCEEADITPHVTPYELRHTAISQQADAGRTSWEIADWAGTSEAMISSRYRHRLRRTSKLLPADPPEN
ncbi:MAG: tyrosine-type recombinase/integrase [Pseudomonadota bacterium]